MSILSFANFTNETMGEGFSAECPEDIELGLISADRQKFGEWAPRISGSLSVISSVLIIFLVFRSSSRLSTTYHRIMVGLSTTDILSSTSMALTHLALPKPGLSPCVDRYSYEGLRIGNTHTCTAQGFFLTFGSLSTYAYNASLCIYYACAIYFKMKKRTIQYKVEPVLHFVAIVIPLSLVIPQLMYENINPIAEHCAVGLLSDQCPSDGIDCARGNPDKLGSMTEITVILVSTLLLVVIIGLSLVCWTLFGDARKIKRHNEQINADDADHHQRQRQQQHAESDDSDSINTHENIDHSEVNPSSETLTSFNRFIFLQALSYIGALLITLIFPILTITSDRWAYGDEFRPRKEAIRRLQLVFQPSQGIFNFLIFLFSKIYQQRVADTNLSRYDALKKIFRKNNDDPIIISRLSILQNSTNSNAYDLNLEVYNDLDEEQGKEELTKKDDDDRGSWGDNNSNNNNENESMDRLTYSLPGNEKKNVRHDYIEGISYSSGMSSYRGSQSHPSGESWSAFSWFSRRTATPERDIGGSAVSSTGLQSFGHMSGVSSKDPLTPGRFSTPGSVRKLILKPLPKTEEGQGEGDNDDDDINMKPPNMNRKNFDSLFLPDRSNLEEDNAVVATSKDINGDRGGNNNNVSFESSGATFSSVFKRQSRLRNKENMCVDQNLATSYIQFNSSFKRRSALEDDT